MGYSVLFVEDDHDTRSMYELALTIQGFETKAAADSFEALEAIQTRKFDAYVLDNWLPEMTGIELCLKLRESDKDTPIIFLSGAAYHKDEVEALAAGANRYFTKPVDFDDLVACLKELLIPC